MTPAIPQTRHAIGGEDTIRTLKHARAPGDQQRVKGGAPGDRQRAKVKVLNRKGIANQTGPESCVAHREVRDEALTGEPAGQPLSRESTLKIRVPTQSLYAEGNTHRRDRASVWAALRGLRPWHVGTLLAREPGDLLLGRPMGRGAVRVGKTRSPSRCTTSRGSH